MIYKKKESKTNNLLNLLFKSKIMYGESLISINKDLVPFLYGSRFNRGIIHLKNVSFFIKRSLRLIQLVIKKRGKILIIGNNPEIQFLLNTPFRKKNLNILFFTKEWINGFITNKIRNSTFNKVIHYLIKKEELKLILIIKSSVNDTFLNRELSSLKIPIISLINTTQTLKNIDYPIVTNTNNIQSIYMLMYLLRKMF